MSIKVAAEMWSAATSVQKESDGGRNMSGQMIRRRCVVAARCQEDWHAETFVNYRINEGGRLAFSSAVHCSGQIFGGRFKLFKLEYHITFSESDPKILYHIFSFTCSVIYKWRGHLFTATQHRVAHWKLEFLNTFMPHKLQSRRRGIEIFKYTWTLKGIFWTSVKV